MARIMNSIRLESISEETHKLFFSLEGMTQKALLKIKNALKGGKGPRELCS